MRSDNSNGSRAASARRFTTLFATMLAMGLGLLASPAEARPFAYVANQLSNSISVIDTATNMVVATVPVEHGTLDGPLGSPSPRTGHTPTSRMRASAPFR